MRSARLVLLGFGLGSLFQGYVTFGALRNARAMHTAFESVLSNFNQLAVDTDALLEMNRRLVKACGGSGGYTPPTRITGDTWEVR